MPTKYPSGTIVKPADCDLSKLKADYGGKLPDIKGRKCKYPPPTNEEAWRKLYAAALTYKNKERYCRLYGLPKPKEPCKSKYEYILYHGRPDKKKDRAKRNRDRKLNGLKKGDKRVVHHHNPNNLQTEDTVKLSFCDHQRMHGKVCKKEKNLTLRQRKRMSNRKEIIDSVFNEPSLGFAFMKNWYFWFPMGWILYLAYEGLKTVTGVNSIWKLFSLFWKSMTTMSTFAYDNFSYEDMSVKRTIGGEVMEKVAFFAGIALIVVLGRVYQYKRIEFITPLLILIGVMIFFQMFILGRSIYEMVESFAFFGLTNTIYYFIKGCVIGTIITGIIWFSGAFKISRDNTVGDYAYLILFVFVIFSLIVYFGHTRKVLIMDNEKKAVTLFLRQVRKNDIYKGLAVGDQKKVKMFAEQAIGRAIRKNGVVSENDLFNIGEDIKEAFKERDEAKGRLNEGREELYNDPFYQIINYVRAG